MSLYKPLLLQLCMIALFAILAGRLRAQSTETPSSEACTTGPAMTESNSIFVNGRQYLSDSGEVACDGPITVWHFCHNVIGFRNLEMELWAGAWRLEEDTFSLVGLNVIMVEPPGYEEDQLRCMEYEVDPFEWIEAKQGDYIGFYLPDNGVFVASASPQSDPEHRQHQRNKFGYAETFNSSEVVAAASSFGRALLRAEINPDAEKPETPPANPSPSPSPSPSILPKSPPTVAGITAASSEGSSGPITQIVVPVVAVVVILALLVVIVVLVVLLRNRRAPDIAVRPVTLPLPRAVDATNPTTGTSDNGSVLYETVYSQAYLQAREMTNGAAGKVEAAYSMISNPAYQKGNTLIRDASQEDTPTLLSPTISNPAYISTSFSPPGSVPRQNSASSFIRYPRMVFRSLRPSAHPTSPPPTTPAPLCPDPPPPPLPYALTGASSRLPPLTLKNPHALSSPISPPPQSPPSPYSNPYKSPRPRSPDSIYEPVLPAIVPLQTMSGSSTMTRGSDQSTGETRSTSPGSSAASPSTLNPSDHTPN